MTARVVVVGLGPAGDDLVSAGTLALIEQHEVRFVRTRRHPSAHVVGDARSFDHLYEAAATMSEVYEGIVEALVSAASETGEVLYAVPGSPVVAEHTVQLLLADERVEVEVHAALSFLDLAWARLGIDPVAAGVRVVDGHRFAVEAAGERGPLLVAQCDRRSVLSDIKLAVDDPPSAPVVLIQRLGARDEHIAEVSWDELDRLVEPDHLTSLWIPELASPVASEVAGLVELVARLRVECPWDREQTHQSLRPYLVEEAHEVVEALDALSSDTTDAGAHVALEEELGDLLFQIVFHAQIATESGRFDLSDVARSIHDKLVARHPHVFGDVEVDGDARVVESNWERLKAAETGRTSAFDGIPPSLPALARAAKLADKARRLGLGPVVADVVASLADDPDVDGRLAALVASATEIGDPESALREVLRRLEDELRRAEDVAPGARTGSIDPDLFLKSTPPDSDSS